MDVYHNPDEIVQSWYPVIASKKLKKGKVKSYWLNSVKIAIYRMSDGKVKALDSRCPHLGTDLSGGKLHNDQLQCPFHHWEFNGDGMCTKIPSGAKIPSTGSTFSFPTEEKYGYVWVFAGTDPLFPIPEIEGFPESSLIQYVLQERILKTHPHLITYNCLDKIHWYTVHDLKLSEKTELVPHNDIGFVGDYKFEIPGNNFVKKILKPFLGDHIHMICKTYGGNLVTTETYIKGKLWVLILFSNTLVKESSTDEILFFLLPKFKKFPALSFIKRILFPAAIFGRWLINYKDIVLLENMRHWVRPSEDDKTLVAYIKQIESMKVFSPPNDKLKKT